MSARLRAIATETVAIVEAGRYSAPDGRTIEIAAEVAAAAEGTRLYGPDDPLPAAGERIAPSIEVTGESTLEAARRLGVGVAALVFASARNPGGGFLGGAKAQEEDIARASALYACQLRAPDFYAYHRAHPDLRYSDRVIYSPDVPVFRDHRGRLLEQRYPVSFLTAAAPNYGAVARNQPDRLDSVPIVVRARAERVLRVAAAHGHRDLVLGAWGCGVFRNDPRVVAAGFADALAAVPRFERVVFAVLDLARTGATYRAFASMFA
jgi:uncharacterized protein (TIGR02452 family)